uniref:Uncharacterized protein n=1 Tax=Anguilla anguilla TaxID=7936 RepID=A0A0E9XFW6_ANGAN
MSQKAELILDQLYYYQETLGEYLSCAHLYCCVHEVILSGWDIQQHPLQVAQVLWIQAVGGPCAADKASGAEVGNEGGPCLILVFMPN